jgi:hypothetical protein
MSIRIDQLEPELAQKLVSPLKNILKELRFTIPGEYRLRVSLLDANGRKKRSNASADNWFPGSGRIEIWFEATSGDRDRAAPEVSREVGDKSVPDSLEVRLVTALDHAESTPGWSFVSLKKFRDEVLPCEAFEPGAFQPTDVHWQDAIRRAIDDRLVLVGKVPNPKSPQFPVTSIRLNRMMPRVQAVLGKPKADLDFHPIHIKGEPLSATILRERR